MKENNKTLLAGLAAVLCAVGIVALVGLFAIHPQKEMLLGEADATEYRISTSCMSPRATMFGQATRWPISAAVRSTPR